MASICGLTAGRVRTVADGAAGTPSFSELVTAMNRGVVSVELTVDAAKRIEQLPRRLQAEFPHVSLSAIEHDVGECARTLIANAHFDDYVPLLVQRTIREQLRDGG